MRSTINLMNIKPLEAGNSRCGVPAPVTLMSSFRVPAIHIAGGGNSDTQNPDGTLDVGARCGFGHCFRGSAPLTEGCVNAVARSPPRAGNPQCPWNLGNF